MPILTVSSEELNLSRRFVVREERFTIGRSDSSGIPIRDKSVSKVHAVISRSPEGYTFQDLWSQNGTFLNEKRCESGILKHGDVLRLGRIRITFELDEEDRGVPETAKVPPAEAAPGSAMAGIQEKVQEKVAGEASRVYSDLVIRTEKRKLFLIALGIGIMGFLIGFLSGQFGSREPPPLETAPSEVAEIAVPDLERVEVEEPAAGPESPAIEEADSGFTRSLDRPYSSFEESERVLFRLFFDLLDRPPTRAEAKQLLPLDHRERWRRIRSLPGASEPSAGKPSEVVTQTFIRFLGRVPSGTEREAFRRLVGSRPGDPASKGPASHPAEIGLLLTASDEYRRLDFRREKSIRQLAGSLIADFLDRPPRSEEALDVERALRRSKGGKAVARILALSGGGFTAFPEDDQKGWVDAEVRRFLNRPPLEGELQGALEEVRRSKGGALFLRMALAGLPEYRSY